MASSNYRRYSVYQTACDYLAQGLSVIPIHRDGSKRPAVTTWKPYESRQPTPQELQQWFRKQQPYGIGIIAGPISDNLVVLDFDDRSCYDEWKTLIRHQRPAVWTKLVRVATPSGGRHIYFRMNTLRRLACYPHILAKLKTDLTKSAKDPQRLTRCELKMAGRYVVAPGSPAACHPLNEEYLLFAGSLGNLSRISTKSALLLVETAQQFDRRTSKPPTRHPSKSRLQEMAGKTTVGGRPGDEFDLIADWDEILEPHGWHFQEQQDGTEYWCRPGKTEGVSATVNYADNGLLYVFSSNAAPLEGDRPYSKFGAYAALNHDGDYSAAAAALLRQGYGKAAASVTLPLKSGRWTHVTPFLSTSQPPAATGSD